MENVKISFKVQEKISKLALNLILDGVNPDFGSKYHTLEGLLAELTPKFAEVGLVFTQLFLGVIEGNIVIYNVVFDSESQESTAYSTLWPVAPGLTPYEVGSLVSYAQVYAIRGLLSRAGRVDDNGRTANKAYINKNPNNVTPKNEVATHEAGDIKGGTAQGSPVSVQATPAANKVETAHGTQEGVKTEPKKANLFERLEHEKPVSAVNTAKPQNNQTTVVTSAPKKKLFANLD